MRITEHIKNMLKWELDNKITSRNNSIFVFLGDGTKARIEINGDNKEFINMVEIRTKTKQSKGINLVFNKELFKIKKKVIQTYDELLSLLNEIISNSYSVCTEFWKIKFNDFEDVKIFAKK